MIELKNLTTGYSPKNPLLNNYSATFEDNKIYGILGVSGIGKTTLLKTIAGLIYPLEGEIYVDGEILKRADKNNIYMMHQQYTSFNWLTCKDNLLIVKKVNHQKITDKDHTDAINMLEAVGLKEYWNSYPSQLSGGQRQRLALARTLFINPSIILMDEPLSALDSITRKMMQDLILDIHKKTKNTIIMVTHDEDEAKKMSDVIINLNRRNT